MTDSFVGLVPVLLIFSYAVFKFQPIKNDSDEPLA